MVWAKRVLFAIALNPPAPSPSRITVHLEKGRHRGGGRERDVEGTRGKNPRAASMKGGETNFNVCVTWFTARPLWSRKLRDSLFCTQPKAPYSWPSARASLRRSIPMRVTVFRWYSFIVQALAIRNGTARKPERLTRGWEIMRRTKTMRISFLSADESLSEIAVLIVHWIVFSSFFSCGLTFEIVPARDGLQFWHWLDILLCFIYSCALRCALASDVDFVRLDY